MTPNQDGVVMVESFLMAAYANSALLLDCPKNRVRTLGSSSVLTLQSLAQSQPKLAKKIFDLAVIKTLHRVLKDEYPVVEEVSTEGRKRIEEMDSLFLQEPVRALKILESVLIIEKVGLQAKDIPRLVGTTLKDMRRNQGVYTFFIKETTKLTLINLGNYVRRRDYLIALSFIAEIDESQVEVQIENAQHGLPRLTGMPEDFGEESTMSLIGPSSAEHLVDFVLDHID